MQWKPFPEIPGVEFKLVEGKHYEGYAMSSDKRIWNCNKGKWVVMQPYKFYDGQDVVRLNFKKAGGFVVFVEVLYKQLFGEKGSP